MLKKENQLNSFHDLSWSLTEVNLKDRLWSIHAVSAFSTLVCKPRQGQVWGLTVFWGQAASIARLCSSFRISFACLLPLSHLGSTETMTQKTGLKKRTWQSCFDRSGSVERTWEKWSGSIAVKKLHEIDFFFLNGMTKWKCSSKVNNSNLHLLKLCFLQPDINFDLFPPSEKKYLGLQLPHCCVLKSGWFILVLSR